MRPVEGEMLRLLSHMPLLDRLEAATVSGRSKGAIYGAMTDLERGGLAVSISHASPLVSPTRRYCLTADGVNALTQLDGMALHRLLQGRPVSEQWRRILLQRLDGVAVIYRVAAVIAAEQGLGGWRWYRAAPLDAAMRLADGRSVGIIRQGAFTDRTAFAKRLTKLKAGPLPDALLLLASDETRLRHARRILAGGFTPTFLALERYAAWAGPQDRIWRMPSTPAPLAMSRILALLAGGGEWPTESPPARVALPRDLPPSDHPALDWLLPSLIAPTAKRALDLIADWPGVTAKELRELLGVSRSRMYQLLGILSDAGLYRVVSIQGRRLALTDRGLGHLARRDRAAVGMAKHRWSAVDADSQMPESWRKLSGRRTRQLLRNVEHTAAVHEFVAALVRQSKGLGWSVEQLDPPHRASRHYRHQGRLRSIHPDAFGTLRKGNTVRSFFLEWERRAIRPATMSARLAPYLRYYSTSSPLDDHGMVPVVLVAFEDELAAGHFHRLAQREMARNRVNIPLWVACRRDLEKEGPMGAVWRGPGSWKLTEFLPVM